MARAAAASRPRARLSSGQRLVTRHRRRAHHDLGSVRQAQPVAAELQRAAACRATASRPSSPGSVHGPGRLAAAQQHERDVADVPVDEQRVRRPRRHGVAASARLVDLDDTRLEAERLERVLVAARAPRRAPPPPAPARPSERARRAAPRARRRAAPCAAGSARSPRRPVRGRAARPRGSGRRARPGRAAPARRGRPTGPRRARASSARRAERGRLARGSARVSDSSSDALRQLGRDRGRQRQPLAVRGQPHDATTARGRTSTASSGSCGRTSVRANQRPPSRSAEPALAVPLTPPPRRSPC